MRPFLLSLIALFFSPSLFASEVKLVRVWPSYRTSESFIRISEYFTGQENPGRRQTLLRTQPQQRQGFYFLTRVHNSGATVGDARIELHVITPRSPLPSTFTFKTEVPHGHHVFQVGVTGADWPDMLEYPVAWRLVVVAADGRELATEQSYLWSKPDKS